MRVALLPLRMLAAWSLVAAASCTAEPEIHSVLVIDSVSADASAPPIDLNQSATAQLCATEPIFPVGGVTLTVEDVVSAREFVITGKYGRERIRPWLQTGTVVRLDCLRARDGEVTESLRRDLVGRRLLEPASILVPPVTADGLRIVGLYTSDLEPLDSIVSSMLDRWAGAESSEPPSSGDVDLAAVSRDSESLQERVRVAVAEAERWSDFRAPPGLVVEWGDVGDMDDALASVFDESEPDPCLAAANLEKFTVYENQWGISLPGGQVVIRDDHDWHELDLHWVLLHELMHQHQFTLCASGMELGNVPTILWQAHATSLTLAILERQGYSAPALAFVRERDLLNGATRAFDELRTQLGLSADDCLRYLASNREMAKRFADELDGPKLFVNLIALEARSIPNDSLSFECTPAEGVVAIINESDMPFSGTSDGWWYSKPASADGRQRRAGDAPFALCLPPRGRVTLKTQGIAPDADPDTCFTVFRRTPAPAFER